MFTVYDTEFFIPHGLVQVAAEVNMRHSLKIATFANARLSYWSSIFISNRCSRAALYRSRCL